MQAAKVRPESAAAVLRLGLHSTANAAAGRWPARNHCGLVIASWPWSLTIQCLTIQ